MNNEPDYDNLYFERKKMIKVGQVYYDRTKHANFAVTVASEGQYGFYTDSIYKSGYVNTHSADWIE